MAAHMWDTVKILEILAGEIAYNEDEGGKKKKTYRYILYSPKTFPKSLSRATLVAVLTVNGLRGRWQDNARAIENSYQARVYWNSREAHVFRRASPRQKYVPFNFLDCLLGSNLGNGKVDLSKCPEL